MKFLRLAALTMALCLPVAAYAAVSAKDLPDSTVWYLHADLAAMRDSDSGGTIFRWFQDEIADELSDEIGIDISKELDAVTAFTDIDLGTVIVVDGALSTATKNKLLKLVTVEQDVDARDYKGKDYFFTGDKEPNRARNNEPFDDLEDAAYFSFDLPNRAVITSTEEQLKELLDSGGKIIGGGNHGDALFVISADHSFVQAGLRPDDLSDDSGDRWESNILRNTEQAALLISDASGMIAVEAQLISTDAKMAYAISGIVNGLLGLQAFNSEIGPEIQSLIQNTKVEVRDKTLSINTVIDPDLVVSALDN